MFHFYYNCNCYRNCDFGLLLFGSNFTKLNLNLGLNNVVKECIITSYTGDVPIIKMFRNYFSNL